jgi:hypothetical protein
MGKLLRLYVYLYVPCMMLVCGARVFGFEQPFPRSISQLHLRDCAPPCWIGIIPGITSVEEAKARLIATYKSQSDFQIKDSGFNDGRVMPTAIENTIEGNNFSLFVRFNIAELIDGKSETVQSIVLFETLGDGQNYELSIRDILGALGPPKWVAIEDSQSIGHEITLKYDALDVMFYARAGRVTLTENPHIYFGGEERQTPSAGIRQWKGFPTLNLK